MGSLYAPRRRLVNSVPRGFSRARLGVAGFIQVRVGSFWRALASPGLFGFACVQCGAHRVRLSLHSAHRG